ncbi:MAG: SCO1664 family protein [Candidatus Dormibacteraceae bacterium]
MAPGPSSDRPDSRARGAALEFDFDGARSALLRASSIEPIGLLHRSSNYTFLVRLTVDATEHLGIYKPGRGETPLWDFPAGTLYRREVAAYVLSRALGWPLVPPTVVREDAPHGPGALQHFVEADLSRHYLGLDRRPRRTWLPVALFDVLANNADRKSGHCLFDEAGRPWMIDHGLTFHREDKLRTVIWDFAGERLPAELRGDLVRVARQLEGDSLGGELRSLLASAEVRMLRRRLEMALEPGWTFPGPSSGWSVPWPVV